MKINAAKFFGLCADKGFMLKDVCKAAGVGYPTLQKIRKGTPIRLDTVGRLAAALDVRSADLICDS